MHQNPDTSISHYLSIYQPKKNPQESNIRSDPRYKLWPAVSPEAVPLDGRLVAGLVGDPVNVPVDEWLVAEFVGGPVDVAVVEGNVEFCHLSTT